jgi:endonuclease G, mitochondrial
MTQLSAPLAGATAHDLDGRSGYDPGFLGVDVPMPVLSPGLPTVLLPYLHYSVLFRPDRRFAAVTAVDMDGAHLVNLARSDRWLLDPRLAAELQAGPAVYAHNDLDRGHLVMRSSSTWGETKEEAAQAEAETFYFTNAAPQAALFNQGRELWLGLEEYLLDHAATFDRKLVIVAGPVLDPADPPYRGIRIPLRFWKVAAFVQEGQLAATGYLLDQTPLVDDRDAAFRAAAEAGSLPPLGAFRTFQVPIADIAAVTGVPLDQLAAVDLLPTEPSVAPPRPGEAGAGWVELRSLADVVT